MPQSYLSPIFNNTTNRFSSRDCLGIESVFATISAELCPIVNTVTPRAFYWPFMCWIYYDFYKYSGIKSRDVNTFDMEFLKRQDYFFVLANLLLKQEDPQLKVDEFNLVGKLNTAIDINNNPDGPFPYNRKYFQTTYGGMQYYNAGCLTMHFITGEDEDGILIKGIPLLTQYGEKMALAFQNVIKNTRYYQEYRLRDVPVPKDVLVEYGKVINLGLVGFDECKSLLRYHLINRNPNLVANTRLARTVYAETKNHQLSPSAARYYLFDYYSPRSENHTFFADFQQTIIGWELAIGRQYLTAGIEGIWKYMLNILDKPMTFKEWSDKAFSAMGLSYLNRSVNEILLECNYSFAVREKMVENIRHNKKNPLMAENGLRLALSIYNRFSERSDLGNAERFLDYGRGRVFGLGSLSYTEWGEIILLHKTLSVRELLLYVMKNCIVEQHIRTCNDKLMRPSQSINGFFFERVDDRFIKNQYGFQVDFQGNRFIQLMQVMKDLDMFDEVDV